MLVVDELEFQKGRPADQVFGAGRILDPGKLDDDPVRPLRDDLRFGDAELIDPVPDRLQALLDGQLLDLGGAFVIDLQGNQPLAFRHLRRRDFEVRDSRS